MSQADLTEAQREYLTCVKRGHEPSGFVIPTGHPYQTCRHCGTTYRFRKTLEEARTPFGWVNNIDPESEFGKIVAEQQGKES